MQERLDFHPDSGSGTERNVMEDKMPTAEQNHHAEGATTFNPSDATNSYKYSQLKKRHHGIYNKNGKKMNDTNIAYDTLMVCNRLECTTQQESRIRVLVKELRGAGKRYEELIIAAVSYVLNEDGRWIQREGEYGDPLHSEYESIRESFNVSTDAVKRHRKTINSIFETDEKILIP